MHDHITSYEEFQHQNQGIGIVPLIIIGVIALFMLASMWKINTKAGKPGWACIIPIYGTIVMLEIAGKPVWWFILFFVPIVSLIVSIMVYAGIANAFGKGGGFVVGLILLPFIFFPILAFGSSQYVGPGGAGAMGGGMQARAY